MAQYFDAHCHIPDIATAERVASLDVPVFAINNSAKISDWETVIEIANKFPNIMGALGIHPWFCDNLMSGWDLLLQDLLRANPRMMVGEIGLDAKRRNLDIQIPIFTRQLELAIAFNRGVHIHCVGAFDVLLPILRAHRSALPPFILFHRFSGSPHDIERLISDYNVYFSYRGTNGATRILATPPERILSETDTSTPSDVIAHTHALAALCQIPEHTLYENAKRMLNL